MSILVFKNFTETSVEEKEQILNWRNSDRIRLKMFDQNIISLEQHLNWISSLKQKKDCLYFFVSLDTVPLGVIDFTELNFLERSGCFGFYTDEKFTMYGSVIEAELLRYFFENIDFDLIKASILESNKKVYLNHKKYFNFNDTGVFYNEKIKSKIFNVILSKSDWKKREASFEKKLMKTLNIQEFVWK